MANISSLIQLLIKLFEAFLLLVALYPAAHSLEVCG